MTRGTDRPGPALLASLLLLLLPLLPRPAQAQAGPAAEQARASAGAAAPRSCALHGRLGLLALERSGRGPTETHLAGGLRAGHPLHRGERLVAGLYAGYLLGYSSDGTEAVSVLALHHLLDLRLEGGLLLGPFLVYLAAGGLVDLARVRIEVLEEEDSALGYHLGGTYAVGVQAAAGRWLLRLEAGGLRRGAKNDLVGEFGVGFAF